MLLLAACEPAEPTAAEVAEKLQMQINELLEEVDESLEEVADLDLDGLCANSGRITAGMDLLVPRYRAFAALMESGDIVCWGDASAGGEAPLLSTKMKGRT